MPYPSPSTYPSALTFPGVSARGDGFAIKVAVGDLVLNNIEPDGTTWTIDPKGFEGWSGSPASTLALTQRARGHGATGSEPFLARRTMSIRGRVKTPARQLSYAEDRLNAACSLKSFRLAVAEDGRVRSAFAQRQDDVIFTAVPGDGTVAEFSIQIVAEDPLKYGDLFTATTLLPSLTGGAKYPVTYPLAYTGVSNSGIIRVTNPGNTAAPVWLRVDGPIPAGGWTVTHVGQKRALTFASSLELKPGEFITVDMEDREVLAQGQAARSGYVTSRGWFALDPGVNDIAFSAQNYSPTAQLTLLTKPAWS